MSGQVRRSVVHLTSFPFEAPVIARILLIILAELTLTVSARLRYLGNAGLICKSHVPNRPQRLASNDQAARTADQMRGLRPPSSFLRAKNPPRTRPNQPATAHSTGPTKRA